MQIVWISLLKYTFSTITNKVNLTELYFLIELIYFSLCLIARLKISSTIAQSKSMLSYVLREILIFIEKAIHKSWY